LLVVNGIRPQIKLAMLSLIAILILLEGVLASSVALEERQDNCAKVHVIGARETTAQPGYGLAQPVVTSIVQAHDGTSEAVNYPACGGQSRCGSVSYETSLARGTEAAAKAIGAFNTRCPNTDIILVGYSQVRDSFQCCMCEGDACR
jgi:acetylxylan esterase